MPAPCLKVMQKAKMNIYITSLRYEHFEYFKKGDCI